MSIDITPGPARLLRTHPLHGELESRGSQAFELEVSVDDLIQVTAEQRGADVELRLFDAVGEWVISVDSPTGNRGPEIVTAIAGRAGRYRIEVHDAGQAGAYTVIAQPLRQADDADRARVASDHQFATGESHRRAMNRLQRQDAGEGEVEEARGAAQRCYTEALGGYRGGDVINGQAHALHRLGLIEKSVERFAAASELFAELGDRRWQAICLNETARSAIGSSELDAAEETLRRALALSEADDVHASSLALLGDVHRESGRMQEALDAYVAARRIWTEEGSSQALTNIWLRIGQLYVAMNDVDEAVDALGRSFDLATERGVRVEQARALTDLGNAYFREGQLESAKESYEEALEIHRELGSNQELALALSGLGTVLLDLEELDGARERFAEALEIFRQAKNATGEAAMLNKQAHLAFAAGELDASLTLHRSASTLFRQAGDRQGEASARYGVARALRDLGRAREARRELEAVLRDAEWLTDAAEQPELRAAYVDSKAHYWELYIDVLMQLHDDAREAGNDLLALDATERWRARTLLDLLLRSDGGGGASPDLVARRRQIQERLNALAGRAAPADAAEAQELARQRNDLLAELRRVRVEIRRQQPNFGDLDPATVTRGAISRLRRDVLAKDTIVLVYSLGERRSFVWAVTRFGVESRTLAPKAEIEDLAQRAHTLLASPAESDERPRKAALGALSERLLEPVSELIQPAVEGGPVKLVVVADGALHYLPFAALPRPDAEDPDTPLVNTHEVTHLPSVSTLLALRQRKAKEPTQKVVVVADPVFGRDDARLSGKGEAVTAPDPSSNLTRSLDDFGRQGLARLPGTAREAEVIRALAGEGAFTATGFEANREMVLSGRLSDYRYVHFATHGLINRRHPELSGLALSRFDASGEQTEGLLPLHEVYDLELNADVVVLSGCETGIGRDYRGEGLVGLTRGFMFAGTPRVVVSLWPVGDDETARLMEAFYTSLFADNVRPSAALRRAQLDMLGSEHPPSDWAAFVFLGDWYLEGAKDDPIETATVGGGDEPPEPRKPDEPVPVPGERTREGSDS